LVLRTKGQIFLYSGLVIKCLKQNFIELSGEDNINLEVGFKISSKFESVSISEK
jgi:hypothetical protein